jgi:hypothetical protein
MKLRFLLLAALAFAAFTPVGFAISSTGDDFQPFILHLPPGSSPASARKILGAPDAFLRPDIWIYWNFGPNADNPAVDTLIVAFEQDRVVAVKTTDGRVLRQLLAQAARNAKGNPVAATPGKR